MKQKVRVPSAPASSANDVLETAEVVRSTNCLLRMSTGVFGFSNEICSAEVFSEDKRKKLDEALSLVFDSLSTCYASLMARYSALKSIEETDHKDAVS